MTLLLGLPRDGRATGALQLAGMLARSAGEDMVVCTVVPAPWPAGPAKVDAEYQGYLTNAAEDALDLARLALPTDLTASFEVVRARSTPTGLLDLADRCRASLLVLGSSPAGATGRVTLGSVADRVLHSAEIPVAMPPRGYRTRPRARVHRVTAAYGATASSDELLAPAVDLAGRLGVGLRLASFAVRPHTMVTAGVGSHAEDTVLSEWGRHIEQAQQDAVRRVAALPAAPVSSTASGAPSALKSAVGHGADWHEAIEEVGWANGDLLVVGSSSIGPLARVFLGSRASKIVRNSPVPVVLMPRALGRPTAG